MNFSDLLFLFVFLPVSAGLYYLSGNRQYRNAVLLLFSLLFYSFGDIRHLPLLVGAAALNWLVGLGVARYKDTAKAKVLLGAGVIIDLGLLFVYKYTAFLLGNVNSVFGLSVGIPQIALPLGISFYSFRMISYIIDVSWEKHGAEKNFFRFLMFVSLFPATVAGPVVRYSEIGGQLYERKTDAARFGAAIMRFVRGLAKKVILADALAEVTSGIFSGDAASVPVAACWIGAAVYALQMYFDFSGYSDMAIGAAGLFGLDLPENFNYPFACRTIAEFWQRWHITLGAFFRDYLLYVPIFGRQRKYLALFLVWFSTGLWHGAAWNYVIWGLYFGLFILIENLLGRKRMKKIPLAVRHIYTKIVIIAGFGIFYFEDTAALGSFLRGLLGLNGNPFWSATFGNLAANNIILILAAAVLSFPVIQVLKDKLNTSPGGALIFGGARILLSAALLVCCVLLLVNHSSNPFLYANF